METYKTEFLVVGATAFAAGLCQVLGGQALVLDRGDLPAAEFCAALRSDGQERETKCETAEGAAFLQELFAREIFGRPQPAWPHLPAAHPVICRYFATSGARFLFRSRLLDLAPQADGWRARVFTTGGEREIRAKYLLDTTQAFETHRFFGRPRPEMQERFLCASADSSAAIEAAAEGPFSLLPGALEREGYLRFAAGGADWLAAHEALLEAWNRRPQVFAHCRILAVAPVLDEVPAEAGATFAENARWVPSVRSGNFVRAFEEGVRFGKECGAR